MERGPFLDIFDKLYYTTRMLMRMVLHLKSSTSDPLSVRPKCVLSVFEKMFLLQNDLVASKCANEIIVFHFLFSFQRNELAHENHVFLCLLIFKLPFRNLSNNAIIFFHVF